MSEKSVIIENLKVPDLVDAPEEIVNDEVSDRSHSNFELPEEDKNITLETDLVAMELLCPRALSTDQFFCVVRTALLDYLSLSDFKKSETLESDMKRRAIAFNVFGTSVERALEIAKQIYLCLKETMTAIEAEHYTSLHLSMLCNSHQEDIPKMIACELYA